MSHAHQHPIGRVVWQCLTVPNAEQVKQFYGDIIGLESKVLLL